MFLYAMSAEIALVQEIEKYPCLYNSYLPEYNRKDLAEEAWAQVAHNNNLTVSDCKEKWRNIRCSFLRSLKPTTRYKKPYYLTAYLQFILPFMKSINNLEYIDELQLNDSLKNNTSDVIVKMEPEEILEAQSEDENLNKEIPVIIAESVTSECIIPREKPTAPRRRKHFTPIVTKTNKKIKKSNIITTNSNKINGNALRFFLLSLLPELETMTDEQVRLFKIKAMLLIDEIKTNDTEIRKSINNINDTTRIQKRLINLLLKNVKKESPN